MWNLCVDIRLVVWIEVLVKVGLVVIVKVMDIISVFIIKFYVGYFKVGW